jgi:hypothetical protein
VSETALTIRDVTTASIYDRMPDPLKAVELMGAWLAKSGMLGVKTPEQGIVVAMTCMQERITPLEFRRRYHIIQGAPSMRADYMQSAFQAAGGRVQWDRTDDEVCELTLTHPDHAPNGFKVRVELAVLVKRGVCTNREQYAKYPRQMLRARAVSEGIRAIMPAINAGEYTPEEMESVQPEHGRPDNATSAPAPKPTAPAQASTAEEPATDGQLAELLAWVDAEELQAKAREWLKARLQKPLTSAAAAKLLTDLAAKADELRANDPGEPPPADDYPELGSRG